MYTIKLSKDVVKFLDKHRDIALRLEKKIEIMKENPFSPLLDVSLLIGQNSCYRLRIGKYRFLFECIEEQILIYFYNADSRGYIYK